MRDRIITVPKNIEAQNLLDFDQANDEQLIEHSISEEEFLVLTKAGIFDLINNIAGIHIDDFEDDSIIDQTIIKKVYEELRGQRAVVSSNLHKTLDCLIYSFNEAIKRNTGVFFYF